MRSNGKLVFTALVGVFMLSAIASASASAASCTSKTGSGIYQLCVNGAAPASASQIGIEGKGATLQINFERYYEGKTTDSCTSTTATGILFVEPAHSATTGAVVTKLFKCALTGTGKVAQDCMIRSEPIFNQMSGGFIAPGAFYLEDQFGSAFAEIYVSSREGFTCPRLEEQNIKGRYECKFEEANVEAVEHTLSCASDAKFESFWYEQDKPVPVTYKETFALAGAQRRAKYSFYEAT